MDLLLVTLLFFLVPISVFAIDDQYEKCSIQFQCGGIDISYPFWGGELSEDCGYPGFKVECNLNVPEITILSRTYRVLKIDKASKVVSVAIKDYWENNCPTNPGNSPLDFTIFGYASDTRNITLSYSCPEELQSLSPYRFSCNSGEPNTNGSNYFYADNAFTSAYSSYFSRCGNNVKVAVWQSTFDTINRNPLSRNLSEILGIGVGLQWNANNDLCDSCEQSRGICGHDSDTSEFTCYCPDQSEPRTCPSSQSGQGQRNLGQGRRNLVIGVVVGGVAGIVLVGLLIFCFIRKRRTAAQSKTRDLQTPPTSTTNTTSLTRSIPSFPFTKTDIERGAKSTYFGAQVFDYSELEQATENFHASKELGDGGFGTVYYGVLKDGRAVAVKRLYENNLKRVEQFMNEIEILTTLRHPNLVTLHGCTSRHSRELLLVYEYIPNGTVADHIHARKSNSRLLAWPVRLSIAVETADALAFLHSSEVIHRDVKTNNILLDDNFQVKVADFGLSRLFPTAVTHVSTAPQGTPGYVDPEYYQCYHLTDKSDVYSFGVVLIELISSLEAVDTNRHRYDINLANMAVNKIQNHALSELVDPSLGFEKDYAIQSMVTSVAELAFRCLQQDRDMRPTMQEVLEVLKGIQNEQFGVMKAEVVDICTEDISLLKNAPPPLSPDSSGNDKSISLSPQHKSF